MNDYKNIQNKTNITTPLGGRGAGISILVFDNYDSFTYNLVNAMKKLS